MKTVIASDTMIRSSVQKVNQICSLIRGKNVIQAILQLQFCKKAVARSIMAVLNSALANSKNNCYLNINCMWIKKILVGKSRSIKRLSFRAKGKADTITKWYTRVLIVLKEMRY